MAVIENIELKVVETGDVKLLSDIMRRAFDQDSMEHTGKAGGPPGYDNGEFISKWCFHKDASAFKILLDGVIVGTVILFINTANHENILGCFFLDPTVRSRGIGAEVWAYVERKYPQTRRWRTETIWYSTYNHYFYVEKCGFKIIHVDNPHKHPEAQYRMEKIMNKMI